MRTLVVGPEAHRTAEMDSAPFLQCLSIISSCPPTLSVSRDNSTGLLSSPEKSAPHPHTKALRVCVCVFERLCVGVCNPERSFIFLLHNEAEQCC